MILIPAGRWTVGTSEAERAKLAKRYDCHPTWLADDLRRHEANLAAFWIDRYPVTNAQYLAFVEATGRQRPGWWQRWGGVSCATAGDPRASADFCRNQVGTRGAPGACARDDVATQNGSATLRVAAGPWSGRRARDRWSG